ncbi:MAG: transglutaminase-like cysteine peptidase, partial [Alphaproteobacteria bacterium]|nr:transglutaminase-like cysteine peptidase [Alphaproteobacteria bacterium]
MDHYPALFGSEERASYNLEPFTKWTGMFNRFERSMQQAAGQQIMRDWQHSLDSLRGLPLTEMAAGVNDLVNAERYITDNRNWGQTDYWATPIEFFTRGGDCEDFAIAKYVSLRALGVPDERLRVAIVQD